MSSVEGGSSVSEGSCRVASGKIGSGGFGRITFGRDDMRGIFIRSDYGKINSGRMFIPILEIFFRILVIFSLSTNFFLSPSKFSIYLLFGLLQSVLSNQNRAKLIKNTWILPSLN
ncbi:uncharacterized protein LOC119990358 [Tripterygium wilfordii]|uniref:uncharacterized protein LOC119990358 n=1 Tax=Tripterygium wilfordii TaxID=458696 RepID=UPI0018F7EC7E|nr:uncharacterized protein LOC119990358 [Tripterygium wilfordii]